MNPRRKRKGSRRAATPTPSSQLKDTEVITVDPDKLPEQIRETMEAANTFRAAHFVIEPFMDFVARYPVFLASEKMRLSKGVLKDLKASEEIYFIPDGVLTYGFAHLPTASDPDGTLFKKLPTKTNPKFWRNGAFLFSPKTRAKKITKLHGNRDMVRAREVFTKHGEKGLAPDLVLASLLRIPMFGRVWVDLDPEEDLTPQIEELRDWLRRVRKEMYGRPTGREHAKTEPTRDTLIYTLREASRLPVREIAKTLFEKEYSEQSAESLESRVKTSLKRTRDTLKAAGLLSPASSRP